MRFKEGQLVKTEWLDSCSHNGWQCKENLDTISKCVAVGWIHRNTKIELCLLHCTSDSDCLGSLSIPKRCVTKITELVERENL